MGVKCASKTASSPNAVVPHLPSDLVPGGAKAGWWSKAVAQPFAFFTGDAA
jgi:hypothetical protein